MIVEVNVKCQTLQLPLQNLQSWKKYMENLDPSPPPPPKSRMGKWRGFALRAASSLIWGGWGLAVPFYFVQDCSFETIRPLVIRNKSVFERQRETQASSATS